MVAKKRTTKNLEQNDEPIPASRPLLIFNHNPKAGGGSIIKVLRGLKPIEIKCSNKGQRGSGCEKDKWKSAFADDGARVNETFINQKEFTQATHYDRVHGFVIGSIREPCSQYLSLWSFGSLGHGAFRLSVLRNPELYGISPPLFNTTDDRNRFLKWMRHPKVVGIVGNRVRDSYSEPILETVDCWVFVEDFQDTLLGCLRMFEDQGGFVDWEAPTVAALLEQQEEKGHHRELGGHKKGNKNDPLGELGGYKKKNKNDPRGELGGYSSEYKDDPLGDPRSIHHLKCETMFDNKTAAMVEDGTESFVYELFGYEGCCKPGTNFYPRTASPEGEKEDAHAATIETLPFKHDTNTTKERAKHHLPASSNHSVRVDKLSPVDINSKNDTHSASSKAFELTFHDNSIEWGDSSTKVGAAVVLAVILLLPIHRFLWKPRRGASQQEVN